MYNNTVVNFLGDGPPKTWIMGYEANNIINKLANKIHLSNYCKNKVNSFFNTSWGDSVKEYNYNVYQLSKKCDYFFIYGLNDRLHSIPSIENLKNVIEIGYTDKSFGIPIDFWAYNCSKHFKKYTDSSKIFLTEENLKHVFLCYQLKPTIHRQLLTSKIIENNLDKFGIVTLGQQITKDKNIVSYKYKNLSYLNLNDNDVLSLFPGNNNVSSLWRGTHDTYTLGKLPLWQSHFLNVVSETVPPNYNYKKYIRVFLSEKVYKPIIGLRPFILNGDVRIYKWLKNAGFDIFEDMWCGYDLTETKTMNEHIDYIIKILSFYCNKTNSEIIKLYNNILPRLIYNQQHFFKYAEKQTDMVNNFHIHLDEYLDRKTIIYE